MRRIVECLGFLRTLLFTLPLIYVFTLALGLVWLTVAPFDAGGRRQHALARLWARLILACGLVRVRVRGRQALAAGRSYVFVANHLSYLDIPVLLAHLPPGVRFMAKASLFHVPFVGWYLRRTGHLPVRGSGVHANARRLLQAVGYIRQGHSIVVFPEGGRSLTGEMGEFKPGIFLAALKAGAPVVPVTLVGSRRVLPRYGWHVRPGRVEMIVDAPVETEGWAKAQLEELMSRVRGRIEENLREAGQ